MTDQMQMEMVRDEIALINSELERTEDPRSAMALVQVRIREMEKSGRKVPDDLIRLERNLKADCISQSRGG